MKKLFAWALAMIFLFSGCGNEETYTVTAGKEEPLVKTVKMAVVGDIMVHDYQYNEAYDPSTGEYDFMHNFQDAKKYFAGNDLVIGNLELTFGGTDRPYSSYPCFNTPDSFLDAVKDAGFNLLTTANNHSMDTGRNGVIRTLDKLDEYDIEHFGTYRSQEERDTIFYKDVNDIRFAFLSYTYGTNGIPVPEDYLVNIIDDSQMVSDIREAREHADVVVVMPHMGNEYESYPRDIFVSWADMMFEAGADIVLASHPHVLQKMEYRKVDHGNGEHDGFIIYSLGNFISSQTDPPRNASIILHLTVEQAGNEPPNVTEVSFVPIWTQFRNASNVNDFVVRSVYERLSLSQAEKDAQIRGKDQKRLEEIHHETASFLLDKEIPLSEMQEEYIFPKPE
ncbi:MAG: CapA family protein [Anaerotignum sp.]|nr:CapA family protein [Anaerotignum sp.]